LSNYLSEIEQYIAQIEEKKSISKENTRRYNVLEERDHNFKQEIHRMIGNVLRNGYYIVNIEKVAEKYKISMYSALNLFLPSYHNYYSYDKPYYYTHNNKVKFLILIPYLILESKAEELKSLLVEGYNNRTISNMSDASSLLTKNSDITIISAHYDFIRRSGFEILPKNQRGEFNITTNDRIIVQKSEYSFKHFFDSLEHHPDLFLAMSSTVLV
jgi:hypothetical protein